MRFLRWRGHLKVIEPLVWTFTSGGPIGLLLLGVSMFLSDVPPASGMHALTAGAMGGMTLAVMTRATLGHTGRPLTVDLGRPRR